MPISIAIVAPGNMGTAIGRRLTDNGVRVLDPHGRQLLLSCGCALFNARVSLADAGYAAVVRRFPNPAQPDQM